MGGGGGDEEPDGASFITYTLDSTLRIFDVVQHTGRFAARNIQTNYFSSIAVDGFECRTQRFVYGSTMDGIDFNHLKFNVFQVNIRLSLPKSFS